MILELLKNNITPENEQREREKLCQECEHYKVLYCAKCGCSLTLKIRLNKAKCPIDRWRKMDAV